MKTNGAALTKLADESTSQGRPRTILDRARDALNARMTKDNLLLVLENVINYAVDLEVEREKLARWHREDGEAMAKMRARVAELESDLAEAQQKKAAALSSARQLLTRNRDTSPAEEAAS